MSALPQFNFDGIKFELVRRDVVVDPVLEEPTRTYPVQMEVWYSLRVTNLPTDREILLEVTRSNGGQSARWVRDRKNEYMVFNCVWTGNNSPNKHTLCIWQQTGVDGTTIEKEAVKTFEFNVVAAE